MPWWSPARRRHRQRRRLSFPAVQLQETIGRIDSGAALAALPDPLIGQRLIGNAADREAMAGRACARSASIRSSRPRSASAASRRARGGRRLGAAPDSDARCVDGTLTALWHAVVLYLKNFPYPRPWRCKVRSSSLPTARRRMSSKRCARPAPFRSSKRTGPTRRPRLLRSSPKRSFWPSLSGSRARRRAGAIVGEQQRKGRRPVHAGHRPHPRRRRGRRFQMRLPSPPSARRSGCCGGCAGAAHPRAARHGSAPHPHAGVARRTAARTAERDPLDDATVLVAGRGRSYPALSVAVGERVGLVGALSVESAARALNARDIDGMVIGDGFGPRSRRGFVTVLAEDVRFRDLPVAVLGGHPAVVEPFAIELANLERISEGPERLVERFLPLCAPACLRPAAQAHAQIARRQRHDRPRYRALAHEAFWRDLNRAVDDAEKRGVGLSIARFSFDGNDRRIGLDAARLVGRLDAPGRFRLPRGRQFDFRGVHRDRSARRACRGAPHRQRAQEHHAGAGHSKKGGIETAVTLATLKPTDSVDSLIARVVGEIAAG